MVLIYRDKQDSLWLGTHEHDVYKFSGYGLRAVKLSSGTC